MKEVNWIGLQEICNRNSSLFLSNFTLFCPYTSVYFFCHSSFTGNLEFCSVFAFFQGWSEMSIETRCQTTDSMYWYLISEQHRKINIFLIIICCWFYIYIYIIYIYIYNLIGNFVFPTGFGRGGGNKIKN